MAQQSLRNRGDPLTGDGTAMVAAHESELSFAPNCRAEKVGSQYTPDGRE